MAIILKNGGVSRILGFRFMYNASQSVILSPKPNVTVVSQRSTSFFLRLRGEQLWHGMTSVSNAGRKRGRGKGNKKLVKNLNIGQIVGVGPSNMVWPGLNAPIIKGKELVERKQLPPDPAYNEKLNQIRDSMTMKFRQFKLNPLDRGWSGAKLHGRSIGAPDPIGENTFEGFNTIVLEFKQVANMTANFGRKRSMSSFVVTGNKQGIVGFALAKSASGKASLRKAKNLAAQRLIYIDRFDDHTIFHDFFTQFGTTKIFVRKLSEGSGLICHRAIKAICDVVGIKNLTAKIDGRSKNIQNICKAFIMGLLQQKTHQKLAEQQKLYVVEFREENGNLPRVVAAPSEVVTKEQLPNGEVPDYNEIVSDGKVPLRRPKLPKFYTRLPGWQVHINKTEKYRNQYEYKVKTVAELGDLTSFVWKDERAKQGPASQPYSRPSHVYRRSFSQLPKHVFR
ncbi:28S ribosomal protein S5, mitochondrial [Chamberlinius hualienensis]